MSDRQETYIYESPDGGDTVYRRSFRSNQREIVKQGLMYRKMVRSQLWRDIFQAAESDPVLQEMIDKVEVYHRLKNSP
jgi:hypothetical protein